MLKYILKWISIGFNDILFSIAKDNIYIYSTLTWGKTDIL